MDHTFENTALDTANLVPERALISTSLNDSLPVLGIGAHSLAPQRDKPLPEVDKNTGFEMIVQLLPQLPR